MRDEHDGRRKRNVRVVRQLDLLFFPKRKAPREDLDPSRWRGSCTLVLEDFQDVKLCMYNLLSCPRCGQRRCAVGLAPGEESCDCRLQIGKWASVSWNLSPPGIRFGKNVDCGSQGENVEDVNVVSSFRPHMGEVQELKREICTVGRESNGDNEVLQEVNALLSVEPQSV